MDKNIYFHVEDCIHTVLGLSNINKFFTTVKKINPIQQASITLGIDKGFDTFYVQNPILAGKDKIPIGKSTKISSGSHGSVHGLEYFKVAIKIFENQNLMLTELAVYELINFIYEDPEKMGLPALIGFGHKFILIPWYQRTLKYNESEDIYQNLCRAIYNLHSIGIIHRDIKFSNVAVHNGLPILFDFGLSTWSIMSKHKSPQTSIQTIWFRSPEVAEDRKRENVSLFASDWWSYGIILASKYRMIYTPNTNADLIKEIKNLFKDTEIPHVNYMSDDKKLFLHKTPSLRMDGSKYLNLPKLIPDHFKKSLPEAGNIFKKNLTKLYKLVDSWPAYFAAVDYCFYMSESESAVLADAVYGSFPTCKNIYKMVLQIDMNIYRTNTYSILTLNYNSKDILYHCFVLSLNGVNFSHSEQAQWIEDYFINNKKDTFPQIEKYYNKMLILAQSINFESLF